MTFTEAQQFVRKLRTPPFDDADTDYDFARMWERRCYVMAWASAVLVLTLVLFGFLGFAVFLLVATVWWIVRYRRFRQVRRLFENHTPQTFE